MELETRKIGSEENKVDIGEEREGTGSKDEEKTTEELEESTGPENG
jgi:hypothetical protein